MSGVTRWLRRYWPNLTMVVAIAVGFGVGALVLGGIPPADRLGPNLVQLGIAVVVAACWYLVLACTGWGGPVWVPGTLAWTVVGMVIMAALLLVL